MASAAERLNFSFNSILIVLHLNSHLSRVATALGSMTGPPPGGWAGWSITKVPRSLCTYPVVSPTNKTLPDKVGAGGGA